MATHLLLLPESEQADARDLDDLEADTGNITLGLSAATETRDEDLVVVVDEVEATVVLTGRISTGRYYGQCVANSRSEPKHNEYEYSPARTR